MDRLKSRSAETDAPSADTPARPTATAPRTLSAAALWADAPSADATGVRPAAALGTPSAVDLDVPAPAAAVIPPATSSTTNGIKYLRKFTKDSKRKSSSVSSAIGSMSQSSPSVTHGADMKKAKVGVYTAVDIDLFFQKINMLHIFSGIVLTQLRVSVAAPWRDKAIQAILDHMVVLQELISVYTKATAFVADSSSCPFAVDTDPLLQKMDRLQSLCSKALTQVGQCMTDPGRDKCIEALIELDRVLMDLRSEYLRSEYLKSVSSGTSIASSVGSGAEPGADH